MNIPLISVIIPALNEEQTIGVCVSKALRTLKALTGGNAGEVIVADNGSNDKTREIAAAEGARVIDVRKKGYGSALTEGFKAAEGEYLIMADADDSYNFEEIGPFCSELEKGSDLVMGNRFKGRIEKGAMPFLHRYLGTPVLTFLSNLFFRSKIGDVNCGMRGLKKSAFLKMNLRSGGMEFATEMIVKASLLGMKITEVPCNLYRDKRNRPPHLRTWADGWRHLRFMLLFTSVWTFFVPGILTTALGLLGMLALFLRDIADPSLFGFIDQKHMLSFLLVLLTGSQIVQLGAIAQTFSFSRRFDRENLAIRLINRYFTLEKGVCAGILMILFGAAIFLYLAVSFFSVYLPYTTPEIRLDMAIFAVAFFLIGVQLIFSSFVLSLFYLKVK